MRSRCGPPGTGRVAPCRQSLERSPDPRYPRANVCRRASADGTTQLRRHGRRLGGARSLRPPARGAAGADQAAARRVRPGRAAVLRHGATSATSRPPTSAPGRRTSSTASACCRRATSRSCGTSARRPATTSSTTRGWRRPLARRDLDDAGRDVAALRSRRGRRRTRSASSSSSAGCSASRSGIDADRAAGPVRAPARGDRGRRRPAADAAGADDQDPATRSRC